MKKLLGIFAVSAVLVGMSATDARAMGRERTWDEIRRDYSLFVEQPDFSGPFGSEGVFNMCVAGNEFRSLAPVKFCAESVTVWHPGHGEGDQPRYETICRRWDSKDVTSPVSWEEQVCVEWARNPGGEGGFIKCVRQEPRTRTSPTTMKLNVYNDRGEAGRRLELTKEFTIPACAARN